MSASWLPDPGVRRVLPAVGDGDRSSSSSSYVLVGSFFFFPVISRPTLRGMPALFPRGFVHVSSSLYVLTSVLPQFFFLSFSLSRLFLSDRERDRRLAIGGPVGRNCDVIIAVIGSSSIISSSCSIVMFVVMIVLMIMTNDSANDNGSGNDNDNDNGNDNDNDKDNDTDNNNNNKRWLRSSFVFVRDQPR